MYRSTIAYNGDQFVELLGDEEGVTRWRPDGAAFEKHPRRWLINRGGYWAHHEDDTLAELYIEKPRKEDPEQFYAFRQGLSLGLSADISPQLGELWSEPGRLWSGAAGKIEQETTPDGTVRVRRNAENRVETWWLDPQRGCNPVRMTVEVSGKLLFDANVTLAKIDDVWFPQSIVSTDAAGRTRSIQIQSARFNEPSLPQELPAQTTLPFEAGFLVRTWRSGERKDMDWTGDKLVPTEEWLQMVSNGQAKPSERIREAIHRGYFVTKYTTPEQIATFKSMIAGARANAVLMALHEWDEYTEQFIRRFDLNTEQIEKARQILAECKKRGQEHLDRSSDEAQKLAKEIQTALDEGKSQQADRLQARLNKLREPIDRIFEEQLKPRLDKLPTRAQRAAAEAGASSKPAAAPKPANAP